jgi:hypothetical protein
MALDTGGNLWDTMYVDGAHGAHHREARSYTMDATTEQAIKQAYIEMLKTNAAAAAEAYWAEQGFYSVC